MRCTISSSFGHDVSKFYCVFCTHPRAALPLPLCSSFRELSGVSVDDVFLLVRFRFCERKKETRIMNRLWISGFCTSLARFSARDQAPDYYIRCFRFFSRTRRNSIIPELLQSATGMYNFSCAPYGKFSGFSRGILFSREYCSRYSRITTTRVSILVLHCANERLYAIKLYLLYL